jgi:hypothetical protein
MPMPNSFHLNFSYQGTDYDVDLKQGKKSKYQVEINGVKYAVLGKKENLKKATDILQSISLKDINSIASLEKRLCQKNVAFAKTQETHSIGTKTLQTPASKTQQVEEAYLDFSHKLDEYAKKNVGKGALLVQVIGVKGAKTPKTYGQLSVTDPTPVDCETIGRTGSGVKLWTALLSKILEKKYSNFIKMTDKLEKFAPDEALRKFGRFEDDQEVDASDFAKEMTIEAQLAMTAGLEYEDKPPKEGSTATLDELIRGPEIPDRAIHFAYDPRDQISFYTNNICLVAYPLEKAYKKVLAADLIQKGTLKDTQTLRELSDKVEPRRTKLQEKIDDTEKHLGRLQARKVRTHDDKLDDEIATLKDKLGKMQQDLNKLPRKIPESVLDLTLQDLLDVHTAYIKKVKNKKLDEPVYVYDLLDQFLMQFDPETLTCSKDHQFAYDDIMKRELLDPLGMTHSGFYGTPGTQMAVTFMNAETQKEQSKDPPHESVLTHGSGFGRTTLVDASKLAKALVHPKGLVSAQGGKVLLTKEELQDITRAHSRNNKNWGLGACITSMNGECFEKGGCLDQDGYSFWVDRGSGIGMIGMTNSDKRPFHLFGEFQKRVEEIYHPTVKSFKRTETASPFPSVEHYLKHPLKKAKEYYEGSAGKAAVLFDWEKDKKGIIHWSGTPFEAAKQKDGTFRITTPGKFEHALVSKIQGAHTEHFYLAIGDFSFKQTDLGNIPTDEDITSAQKELAKFAGDYTNPEKPEWGVFRFDVQGDPGNLLLRACYVDKKSQVKALTPLAIVKVERQKEHPQKINAISFNGHGIFDIPDKIFRFVLDPKGHWQLEVSDVFTGVLGKPIETRSKDLSA